MGPTPAPQAARLPTGRRRIDPEEAQSMNAATLACLGLLAGIVLYVVSRAVAAHADSDCRRAKMDVLACENASRAFKADHGRYPTTIHEMAQAQGGRPAYVAPDKVCDPWGQEYHCYPCRVHPTTRLQQFWSDGPPSRPCKIANWYDPGDRL